MPMIDTSLGSISRFACRPTPEPISTARTGTRVTFEHAGFDLTQPWGEQALRGAEYGWDLMLKRLADVFLKSATQLRSDPDGQPGSC